MSSASRNIAEKVRKLAPGIFSVILIALLASSFLPPELLPVHKVDLEMTDMEDDTETNNKENEREVKKEDKIIYTQAMTERSGLAQSSLAFLSMYLNWTNHILDISTPPPEKVA